MASLFDRGELRVFLQKVLRDVAGQIEELPEDEVLARSTEDLLEEFVATATLAVPALGNEPIDGKVDETSKQVRDQWGLDRTYTVRGFTIGATYEFTGDSRLFQYRPSRHQMTRFDASIGNGRIMFRQTRRVTTLMRRRPRQQSLRRSIRSGGSSASLQPMYANTTLEWRRTFSV